VRADGQLLSMIDGVPDYDYIAHTATLRGVVRQRLVTRALRLHLPPAPARIVDVGGGTGIQGLALAGLGYEVTICEPDPRMVGEAAQAIAAAPADVRERVRLVQGDGLEVATLAGRDFDAALCHGVIMFIPEPERLLRVLVDVTRPGGTISVVGKNGPALALRAGLQGRWGDVLAQLAEPGSAGPAPAEPAPAGSGSAGSGSAGSVPTGSVPTEPVVLGPAPANRGDDPTYLRAVLTAEGAQPLAWYGIRTFTDHLADEPADVGVDQIVDAEWVAGTRDPYRQLARLIHLVHRRGD
jgi:SAM-dependent methyltransferase